MTTDVNVVRRLTLFEELQGKKAVAASTESAARVVRAKAEVADSINAKPIARHVHGITNPRSPRTTMRKAGVALIAAPDPVTTAAGVGLFASSYAFKKEPASLTNLALETRKILRDLRSLSV